MIRVFIDEQEVNIIQEPTFYRNRLEQNDGGTIIVTTLEDTKFKVYSKVRIETSNGIEQFLVQGDQINKLAPHYYEHTVTLVENKAFFSTIFPPDRVFTKTVSQTSIITGDSVSEETTGGEIADIEDAVLIPRSLKEILQIYQTDLSYFEGIFFRFDEDDIIFNAGMPEKEYDSRNFAEIVNDLFRRIEAIPRFNWDYDEEEWVLTYELYTDKLDPIDLSDNYLHLQSENDNSDYGTSVLSKAKNAVLESNPIWFPSRDGYVKARSEPIIFQDDEAYFELDSNIHKLINVFVLDVPVFKQTGNSGEVFGVLPLLTLFGANTANNRVLTEEESKALTKTGLEGITSTRWYQDEENTKRNTILYKDNRIYNLFESDVGRNSFGLEMNNENLLNAIQSEFFYSTTVFATPPGGSTPISLTPERWAQEHGIIYSVFGFNEGNIPPSNITNDLELDELTIRNTKLRVQYVPERDLDFEIEAQDVIGKTKTTKINSQGDSRIELSRYAQSMKGFINRIGNEQIQYMRNYEYDEPIPKIGDYYDNYILTNVRYTYYRSYVSVLMEFTKNFNNLKAEYSASREISPFIITGKELTTNLRTKSYAEVSLINKPNNDRYLTEHGKNALVNPLLTSDDYNDLYKTQVEEGLFRPNETPITQFDKPGKPAKLHMNVFKTGEGGNLIFNTKFNSPIFAGDRLDDADISSFWDFLPWVGSDYIKKEGIIYTNDIGELSSFDMTLGNNIRISEPTVGWDGNGYSLQNRFGLFDTGDYPIINENMLVQVAEFDNIPINKDPNAKFAMTYHIVPVTDNPEKIVINSNFAKYHSMITGQDSGGNIKFYKSTTPYNIFDNIPKIGDIEFFAKSNIDRFTFEWTFSDYGVNSDVEYWCITDSDDNILIAFNNSSIEETYYWNFRQNRDYGFNAPIPLFNPDIAPLSPALWYENVQGLVEWDALGGTPEPETLHVAVGDVIEKPEPDPQKAGFVFIGWEVNNQNITFPYEIVDGFTLMQSIYRPIVNLDDPSISINTIYYAEDKAVVEYDVNGGQPVLEDTVVTLGDTIPEPQEIFRSGYVFIGWRKDGDLVTFPYTVNESRVTLEADWQIQSTLTIPEFTNNALYYVNQQAVVQFDTKEGLPKPDDILLNVGDVVEEPTEIPVKDGFVFLGWDTTFPFTVTELRTIITALYQEIQDNDIPTIEETAVYYEDQVAVVRYDSVGGTPEFDDFFGEIGDVIQEAPGTPTKAGFLFLGWSVEFPYTITQQITNIKAQWQEIKTIQSATIETDSLYYETIQEPTDLFSVLFVLNGGTVSFNFDDYINLESGTVVEQPADPTRDGFIFDGWDTEFPITVNSNISVEAQWLPIETLDEPQIEEEALYYEVATQPEQLYNIIFDLDGGTLNYNEEDYYGIEDGEIVNSPGDPTKAGWQFIGWDEDFPLTVTSDLLITAQFVLIGSIIEPDIDVSDSLYYGTPTTPPPLDKAETPGVEPIGAGTSTVSFRITNLDDEPAYITYNIREGSSTGTSVKGEILYFEPNQQITVSQDGLDSGTEYFLTNVVAEVSGKETSDPAQVISEETTSTYVISFRAEPLGTGVITVNYNGTNYTANSNDPSIDLTVQEGESMTVSTTTSDGFFDFVRWNINFIPNEFTTNSSFTLSNINSNAAYIAEWVENIPQATATFNSAGGSPDYNSITGDIPLSVSSPGSPSRTGYTFDGWSPGLPTTINEDTTFTAQWTPITYNITYNLNGGVNNASNPSTYTVEDTPVTLLNPSRYAFDFTGWNPPGIITSGETGNKTFSAEWQQARMATPSVKFSTSTQNSITFQVRNNENRTVLFPTVYWEIREGSPTGTLKNLGSVLDAVTGQWYDVSATGLETSSVYYLVNVYTEDVNEDFLTSFDATAINGSTLSTPTTARPTILEPPVSITETSVTYDIQNNDGNTVRIFYDVNDSTPNKSTGDVLPGDTVRVTVTGLNAEQTYTFYAKAQSSTKLLSSADSDIFTTPAPPPQQTTEPTISNLQATDETSFSFVLTNNIQDRVYMGWEVREGSQFGTLIEDVRPEDQLSPLVSGTTTVNITGLNSGTVYYVRAIALGEGNYSLSEFTDWENITTQAPPPDRIVRAKLNAFEFLSSSIQWQISDGGNYDEQGQTNINTSNYVTLRSSVPNGSFGLFQVPNSFVYNNKTWTFFNWIVNGGNEGTANPIELEISDNNKDIQAAYSSLGGF